MDGREKVEGRSVEAASCLVELQQLRRHIDTIIQLRINALVGLDANVAAMNDDVTEQDRASNTTGSPRRSMHFCHQASSEWGMQDRTTNTTGSPRRSMDICRQASSEWGLQNRTTNTSGSPRSAGVREPSVFRRRPECDFGSEDTAVFPKPNISERTQDILYPSSGRSQGAVFHSYAEEERKRRDSATRTADVALEREYRAQMMRTRSQDALRGARCLIKAAVERPAFDYLFGSLVVASSFIIGLDVELDSTDPRRSVVQIVMDSLSVAFVVELVLRIVAKGSSFFSLGPDVAWNYLDTLFVLLSMLQYVIKMASDGVLRSKGGEAGLMVIRLSRFARFIKLVRVIRVMRFFRALRILVHSICGTLKSLVWALVLLGLIIYLFAIIFTQAVREHVDASTRAHPLGPSDKLLVEYFGSIPRGMLTLLKCITAGMNWESAANLLSEVHPVYVLILLAYVTFSMLAVLNVITGFFCQSAIESAESDDEELIQTQLKSTCEWRLKFEEIFNQIDEFHFGKITLKQFEGYCDNDRVKGYFEALGLDVSDAWRIFKFLDMDESGTIGVDEFVDGCLQMRGAARRIDVGEVLVRNRWMMDRMASLFELVETSMQSAQAFHHARLSDVMRPNIRVALVGDVMSI